MQPTEETYDFHERAREKQESREQDLEDLRSGRKSLEQLCRENELLAPFARTARVDIDASISLG
ncbi:MAG: hypothetical protein ACRDK4_03485 [Solirubrobacteraceae bacterium]